METAIENVDLLITQEIIIIFFCIRPRQFREMVGHVQNAASKNTGNMITLFHLRNFSFEIQKQLQKKKVNITVTYF